MTSRKPLVNVGGVVNELPTTDAADVGTAVRTPNALLSGYAFLDGSGASAQSTQQIGASVMAMESPSRVVGRRTLSTCVFEVTTLGTNLRVGLASIDPTNGQIAAIVHDFGQIDVSGTGLKTVSGLTDVLTDGWYAGIAVADTTAVTLRQYTCPATSLGVANGAGTNVVQQRATRGSSGGQYTGGFTVVSFSVSGTAATGGIRYFQWTWG